MQISAVGTCSAVLPRGVAPKPSKPAAAPLPAAVVRSLSQDGQSALLKFVTSCRRAPLGGFQHLNPPFTIHKV
jgi:hypothetical protein